MCLRDRLYGSGRFSMSSNIWATSCSLPIVAVGTQDAFNTIQADSQVANRFEPVALQRWTMGEDYLRLLASSEKVLPLEHRSELLETAMAIKILSLSEGTIGEISALLCRAAVAAIETVTEGSRSPRSSVAITVRHRSAGVLSLWHIDSL
jgi:hypothetical protein